MLTISREQVSSKQKTLLSFFNKPGSGSASATKGSLSRKQKHGSEGSCDHDDVSAGCVAKKAKTE